MKKTLLIIAMFFVTLGLAAQEVEGKLLGDQKVVPPKFKGIEAKEEPKAEPKLSPICCFIQENLEIEMPSSEFLPEGTVAIEFTVNRDGSLSNFTVVNPVNHTLELAVIECIKETEGMWQPGAANDNPVAMEKRVYVRFDRPDNDSFEEIARRHYLVAVKKFNKGVNAENNQFLTTEKKNRKAQRAFNSSLNCLNEATVLLPNEPTIAFWKARNYEHLGMHKEMIEMLEQRKFLLSLKHSERTLTDYIDMAIITLK